MLLGFGDFACFAITESKCTESAVDCFSPVYNRVCLFILVSELIVYVHSCILRNVLNLLNKLFVWMFIGEPNWEYVMSDFS